MADFAKRTDVSLWAGVVTWAVVSGMALYFTYDGNDALTLGAAALAVVNLLSMVAAAKHAGPPAAVNIAAFWLQLASAFAAGALLRVDFLQIYTIIWMAMAPAFLSLRTCVVMLVLIMLAWLVQLGFIWEHGNPLVSVALFATFHLFALISTLETRRAERATAVAEARNRELQATQQLLAQAAAQSERTRIARNLHDLLGHHLTALTINLQVAARRSDGEVRDNIEQCHSLARLLLADVREAVSTLRDADAVDLTEALELMADGIPGLDVHLDIDPALNVTDIRTAESLLRCVQEALTNTLRHASATAFWLTLGSADGRIELTMRDDGRSDGVPEFGNGLTGMRERIEQLRGRFDVATKNNALNISITVPA